MRCKKEQKRIENKASKRLECLFGKDERKMLSKRGFPENVVY
jgi:hypothetical protein